MVHWHLTSVTPQPELGTAATRQEIWYWSIREHSIIGNGEAYSAVGDAGQIRGLGRDDGERSSESGDGGETHVDRCIGICPCITRVEVWRIYKRCEYELDSTKN